ncbi:MAG: M50 family metallopeptidase, partial [Candidatus Methanomethyliaceae archaeon]|nr:M50 family metallopeptidase [Candidatus Methanomethyliaceae archaeon]
WDVVIGINNHRVYDARDLEAILKSLSPGSMAELSILRGGRLESLTMILGTSPTSTLSYLVIYIYPYYAPKYSLIPNFIPFYLFNSLNWIYMLSLSVGLINIMPIPALDGDKLANVILKYLFKNGQHLYKILRWYCLMVLLLNISISFVAFPSFRFG